MSSHVPTSTACLLPLGPALVDLPQFEDIQEAVRIDQSIKTNPYRTITRRRYWPQLCITILVGPAMKCCWGV
jgi:hypothetical protein